MKRRLGTLLASLVLLFSMTAVLPSAALAAGNGPCEAGWRNYHAFQYQGPTGGYNSVDAVRATVNPESWADCVGSTDQDSAVYGFVSLAPINNGTENTLVQVGTIQCWEAVEMPAWSPCEGAYKGTFRIAIAWGGCNGTVPEAVDFGPTNSSTHTYMITREADGFRFYIDGSWINNWVLDLHASSIDCWAQSALLAGFDVERNDRGNAMGQRLNGVTYWTHIGSAQISNYGQSGWVNTTWTDPCDALDSPSGSPTESCDVLSVNSYHATTIQ